MVAHLVTEALHRIGALLSPTGNVAPDLVLGMALPDIKQAADLMATLATRGDSVIKCKRHEDDEIKNRIGMASGLCLYAMMLLSRRQKASMEQAVLAWYLGRCLT